MKKQELNWYNTSESMRFVLEHEFINDVDGCSYEMIYPVQEGDIVLDLGASIGIFTWAIMDKASRFYTVEPLIDLIPTIKENTKGYPVTIINKLLSFENSEVEFTDGCINNFEPKIVKTIDFKTLLKKNNLDYIDYIKVDIEGSEYSLFRDENMPFLLNNVRNIVGEFHLGTKELKTEFRYFRDKYLSQFKNFEVRSVDAGRANIKWDIGNDSFLEYYSEIMIHISNE